MDPIVFVAVLAAAIMHAVWNSIVKIGADRFVSVTLISAAGGVAATLLLPFAMLPPPAALPFLAASVVLHTGYKLFLIKAYEAGDLAQVYPLARGAAPLMVTLISLIFLADPLSPLQLAGILTLACGIFVMALYGGMLSTRLDSRAVAAALITSVFVAAYTLSDGLGGRRTPEPVAYAIWLFALDGWAMVAIALAMRGRVVFAVQRRPATLCIAGGLIAATGYALIIWAMAHAPVAAVAALRETSILFALIIAVVFLRETLTPARLGASGLIIAGIILMRL